MLRVECLIIINLLHEAGQESGALCSVVVEFRLLSFHNVHLVIKAFADLSVTFEHVLMLDFDDSKRRPCFHKLK